MAWTSAGIRRSLMVMLLLTSGAVVLVTVVAFSGYEYLASRAQTVDRLATLAQAIASNSTAALAFDNADDARETLAALKAEPHVVMAGLYAEDGALFATYPRGLSPAALPKAPPRTGQRFQRHALIVARPVVQDGQRLGTLVLESDLGAIYEQLRLYALLGVVVLAASFGIAYVVASWLQRRISQPILALAGTARAVSENRDYSVRAPPVTGTEFALLTGAFNHMLTRIEQGQRRMHSQLIRLDLLQRITRAIGERQDLPSIFGVVLSVLEEDLPVEFTCACLHEAESGAVHLVMIGPKSAAPAVRLKMMPGEVIPIDENGLARCVTGELVYEPDTGALGFAFPRRFAAAGLRSLIIAPLLVENRVVGMLLVARGERDAFSSGDCEFLLQLSQHVALAARQAQLHEALQRAYDDLRQSQQAMMQQERLRALGQMASGIAHDINNAISPVSLYTDLLLESEAALSERGRNQLATIQRAIEDVASTVARMREFYRPREEQLVLARVPLNRLIGQVVELTRARWSDLPQQRGVVIRLHMELAEQLPEIMGAEGEIRDALTNLIFNAVDAMPEGGTLTLRTRATAAQAARTVCVEVCDSGVGMDEQTRRRCLEPFFTTKGDRGTGLGLAMVYGMVQRHSAELEIDSIQGQGTTVRLSFPVWEPSAADTLRTAALSAPARRLRLLLVDDDPLLIQSLRDILEADGHAVTPADGGQNGIAAFRSALERGQPFDAVITDLGMPHVDGRAVAVAVEELAPQTPLILLTGWGRRLQSDDEVPPYVDRVLSKPPRIADLREALAALTARGPEAT